jgi:hypothetical protein
MGTYTSDDRNVLVVLVWYHHYVKFLQISFQYFKVRNSGEKGDIFQVNMVIFQAYLSQVHSCQESDTSQILEGNIFAHCYLHPYVK